MKQSYSRTGYGLARFSLRFFGLSAVGARSRRGRSRNCPGVRSAGIGREWR